MLEISDISAEVVSNGYNSLNEDESSFVKDQLSACFDNWEKAFALGEHLELSLEEILDDVSESRHDDCLFEYGSREYLVCTDSEADEKAKESAQSLVDDTVLCQIPESLQFYFDDEKYIDDILRHDGRESLLAGYDGNVHEVTVDDTMYFIYRTN